MFTLDSMFAIGIFVVILVGVAWSWNLVTERIRIDNLRIDMELSAKNAMSVLLENQGKPGNWHNKTSFTDTSVEAIGVSVSYPNIIHREKVSRLEVLNNTKYDVIQKILGIQKYDFVLNFYVYNGSSYPIKSDFEIGNASLSDTSNVVVVNRYGLIDSNWTLVRLKVWE